MTPEAEKAATESWLRYKQKQILRTLYKARRKLNNPSEYSMQAYLRDDGRLARCPRCTFNDGAWIHAWILSDHLWFGCPCCTMGAQNIPVTCCSTCYLDIADNPDIVWHPATIRLLESWGKPTKQLRRFFYSRKYFRQPWLLLRRSASNYLLRIC